MSRTAQRDEEMAKRRDAEMAAIRSAAIPPRATDAELKTAGLELVNRLARLARTILRRIRTPSSANSPRP
jgi:hypothetical protein